MRRWLLFLLLLLLPVMSQARTFPATSDPSLADQERWGSFSRGYVTDGCWHGTAAGTTAQIASCRAFVLETADPESLQGFEEMTPRSITYNAGDGTYLLGGRSNPSLTPAGWTCLAGLHYCTLKADAPPEAVSGLVVLGKTTVSAGAISAFTIMAPWRRTTPYTVPAATTLTFGVCPEAGPVPLFVALDDATSGRVRWTPDACHHVLPEWWGVDPTGVVDSTTIWRQVLASSRATVTPVWCQGTYLLSATEPAQALPLVGGEQIMGRAVLSTTPQLATIRPCQFTFAGTGRAFGTTTTNENKPHIYLQNLLIVDRDGTGARALDLTAIRGGSLHDIQINGFHTGFWLGTLFYYGDVQRMRILNSRVFCADLSGSALNGARIEIGCNTESLDLDTGIRIGAAPGLYGTGHNARLEFVVETYSGTALAIHRQKGFELKAYVEIFGNVADHNPLGAVVFSRVQGATMTVRVHASMGTGTPPIGLHVLDIPAEQNELNRIKISGEITNFTMPLQIDGGDGVYGIDTSQLAFNPMVASIVTNYTTGTFLGQNLVTHGPAPTTDVGRGNTASGETWLQGDVVWSTLGNNPGTLTNVLRIVNTAGNPPVMSTVLLPTTSIKTVLAAETTPSVKVNQIFTTRLNLDAGSAITDFIDETVGMCIWLRALGARTITDGAQIDLPTGNFAMTLGDTLLLCIEGGVWREYARTDYP